MSTMYVVTVDNYREILNRLERICNRFRMLEKYECFRVDHHTKKEKYPDRLRLYKCSSWGFTYEFDEDSESYVRKPYQRNIFVKVTEHVFKKAYDKDPDSYDGKYFKKMGSLIHLSIGASSAIVLGIGDKIEFTKWGFTTYTDNAYTNLGKMNTLYKHSYIKDRVNGRISDIQKEIDERHKKAEEAAKWWEDQYIRELEDEWREEEDW